MGGSIELGEGRLGTVGGGRPDAVGEERPDASGEERLHARARRIVQAAVAAAFIAIAAALTVAVEIAENRPFGPKGIPQISFSPEWIDGWFRYDAGWYYGIAEHGYFYIPGQQSSIAFFPSYPLSIRGLSTVIGSTGLAQWLIAITCGLIAVMLFAGWASRRLSRRSALTAIAVLMLYPYAIFLYGAMYSDSLFLAVAIGAFIAVDRERFLLAGMLGVVATAGRSVGVAVAAGLLIRMLEMRAERVRPVSGPNHDRLRIAVRRPQVRDLLQAVRSGPWRGWLVCLSGIGLLAWCIWLWMQYGDPVAWATVQSAPGWYQGAGPRTWFKVVFAGTLIYGPWDIALTLIPQAVACLLAWLLLRRVWRLFGWGYATYTFFILAIPTIGTKDFMGVGRYVLVAFPVMAAAGDLLARLPWRWPKIVVPILLAAGLLLAAIQFSKGFAVS